MNASIRNDYERCPRSVWRLADIDVTTKDLPGEREVTVTTRRQLYGPTIALLAGTIPPIWVPMPLRAVSEDGAMKSWSYQRI